MDFELVKPSITQTPAPKPSSDSLSFKAWGTSSQRPSPITPDAPGVFLGRMVLRAIACNTYGIFEAPCR
jgi:hypothetical protein